MMKNERTSVLGKGIYTLSETARFTSGHINTIRSWFKQRTNTNTPPVFLSDYRDSELENRLSFHDLIDVLVAVKLRESRVPMKELRLVFDKLQDDLKTQHPFCHKGLYVHNRKVFVEMAKSLNSKLLVEALTDQSYIKSVMLPYLKKIDYDSTTHLASRWNISEGIIIDPKIRFGTPIVKGAGISTDVLSESYYAEKENADFVSELFGVTTKAVNDAVEFESQIMKRRAA